MEVEEAKRRIAGVFGRSAATYDRAGPSFFGHFGRRVAELAEIPAGACVLDVAAGAGASLVPAAELAGPNGHVVGVDLSPGMVRRLREEIDERGLVNGEAQVMDATVLEFPDASFDRILCGWALFFFPEPERVLERFRDLLRPGGRIVVSTFEDEDEGWSWLDELLLEHGAAVRLAPEGARRFDDADELRAALEAAGFDDVGVRSEPHELVFGDEDEWWAWGWTHGFRAALEAMDDARRERFRKRAFERLRSQAEPDGIHRTFRVLLATARRR